jgi:NAD(P)H-hydrate epimerase
MDRQVPAVTTAQMREVDRVMIEVYGIELAQMMENAGRNLARVAQEHLMGRKPTGKQVVVLAGKGGNGGGAIACARRLAGWGVQVTVVLARARKAYVGVPGHQLTTIERMGVPVCKVKEVESHDLELIIDGLIGYDLHGAPRGHAAELISWANRQSVPILALDVPSGLDATTGKVYQPCIQAAATMTLALPKSGLFASGARPVVGDLYVADIGVPLQIYALPSIGLEVGPIFAEHDVIRLW